MVTHMDLSVIIEVGIKNTLYAEKELYILLIETSQSTIANNTTHTLDTWTESPYPSNKCETLRCNGNCIFQSGRLLSK